MLCCCAGGKIRRKMKILAVVCGPTHPTMEALSGSFVTRITSSIRTSIDNKNVERRLLQDISWVTVEIFEGRNTLASVPIHGIDAIIISGSRFNITEGHEWVEVASEWIRQHFTKVPMLGICFGHQLIAHALGGEVAFNPRGAEFGTFEVWRTESTKEMALNDPLVKYTPVRMLVQEAHFQTILRLPTGSVGFYESERDSYQIVRFGELVYGLQFHPEYDVASMRLMAELVPIFRDSRETAMEYLRGLKDATPEATGLVASFLGLVVDKRALRHKL